MNLEVMSSLLVQSNWIFLAGWLLLLVTAFGLCFSEKSTRKPPARSNFTHPR